MIKLPTETQMVLLQDAINRIGEGSVQYDESQTLTDDQQAQARKNIGLLDVKSFGAVGDGVTNDRDAIQSALSALEAGDLSALYFPSGEYLVRGTSDSGGSYFNFNSYQLKLGTNDLDGRDISIIGDGATIFFEQSSASSVACLWVNASFRNLIVKGIRFERSNNVRVSTPGSEPNFNDLVSITPEDDRIVDSIAFDRCIFFNGHKAIAMSGGGTGNRRDKLRLFRISQCQILNPYGANTDMTGGGPYGGGQQVGVDSWVHTASITDNYWLGGADSYPDGVNPCGFPLDGTFFGYPRESIFTGNTCVFHGEETFYHTPNYTFLSITADGFTMPSVSGTVDVDVEPGFDTTFEIGDPIWIASAGAFTVSDVDGATLTLSNDGGDLNAAPATVISTGKFIYSNVPSESRSLVTGNTFSKGTKIAIVSGCRSIIKNNVVSGKSGVILYTASASQEQDDCAFSIIEGNQITLNDNALGIIYSYGIRADDTANVVVKGNCIESDNNVKVYGIYSKGDNSSLNWTIEGNHVFARDLNPQLAATRGIGIAIQTDGCVARGNRTGNWDYGIGSEPSGSSRVLGVIHHEDSTSTIKVDGDNTGLSVNPRKTIGFVAHNNGVPFPVINWDTAYTNLSLSTAEVNEGDHYDSSTGIFTVPFTGWYEFGCVAKWTDDVSSSDLADIWLEDYGGAGRIGTIFELGSVGAGNARAWQGSLQIKLNRGMSAMIRITQHTGTTKNLNGDQNATRIWGKMIP